MPLIEDDLLSCRDFCLWKDCKCSFLVFAFWLHFWHWSKTIEHAPLYWHLPSKTGQTSIIWSWWRSLGCRPRRDYWRPTRFLRDKGSCLKKLDKTVQTDSSYFLLVFPAWDETLRFSSYQPYTSHMFLPCLMLLLRAEISKQKHIFYAQRVYYAAWLRDSVSDIDDYYWV